MRNSLGIAILAIAIACKGTEPTPVGDAVNGTWKGATGATNMSVDIHSVGESGLILGSGTFVMPSGSQAVDVEGAYTSVDKSMSLHLVNSVFEIYFTGTMNGRSMPGALQGSVAGYNNVAITLAKQ